MFHPPVMSRIRLAITLLGLSACAGSETVSPKPDPNPTTPTLSLRITPRSDSVVVGATRNFAAVVTDQNGQVRSDAVSWSTIDPQVASINADGVATGLAAGSTRIVARAGSASDTVSLAVLPAISALAIIPNAVEVALGDSIQMTADFGVANSRAYGDPVWTSSDSSVAYMRDNGQLVSVNPGDATITVSLGTMTATASARVEAAAVASVTVSPSVATLSPGGQVDLTAVAKDSYGRRISNIQVDWTSSNTSVATVHGGNGVVTARAQGFTVVTAKVGSRRGSATITVGPASVGSVSVTLNAPSVAEGTTTSAQAVVKDAAGNALSGHTVAWQSSNPSVGTVNSSGVVTGLVAGTTTISAIAGGKSGNATLTVYKRQPTSVRFTPTSAVLSVGQQTSLIARVYDQGGAPLNNLTVTYSSANPAVAAITANGVLSGVAAGSTTVTARYNTLSATANVTVSPVSAARVSLDQTSLDLMIGNSTVLTATAYDAANNVLAGRVATWSSSNTAVATVDAAGAVDAIGNGTATITVTIDGKTATAAVNVSALPQAPAASITVSLNAALLLPGQGTQAAAVVKDDNGNVLTGKTLAWSSSDPALATVSPSGYVTAVAPGSVSILAQADGQTGAAALQVDQPAPAPVASVTLSLNASKVAPGSSVGSNVVLRDAQGNILTGRTVGYTSLKPTIATANVSGNVTGVSVGDATIVASSSGVADSANVEVSNGAPPAPVLTSIVLSPATSSISVGQSYSVTAAGKDQNGANIGTGTLTWSSSNAAVASVTPSGYVTALASGTSTIRATSAGGIAGSATVTVTTAPPAAVSSVSVTLNPATVNVGTSSQANVVLKDAGGNVLTGYAITYSSSNTAVATVGTAGAVTTLGAGTATITAQSGGKSGAATLTVNAVAPPPPPPPPSGTGATRAAMPTRWVNSAYVAPTGKTITLKAGDNLQTAVNNAQRGDVILLPPGVVFAGGVKLPNKPGTGWITIRSAAPDAQLPAAGQRMTPTYASLLPKLHPGNGNQVISTDPGARFYRFMFVEITVPTNTASFSSLVRFGDPSNDQTGSMPSDLVLDRSYVHGTPNGALKSCIILSSAATAIIDSHVSDCKDDTQDSQAIVGWNGAGPYKITNNFLEGAGENIMFGGAYVQTPGNIPADIEIRGNHITKNPNWKTSSWLVKNLIEIKFAHRVLIEGNIIEGSWQDAQTGYAINLKTSTPNGMNWGSTEDVTIRGNIIRNAGAGISMLGSEGGSNIPANRLTIVDNLITDIRVGIYQGAGNFSQALGGVYNVTYEHNTIVSTGAILNAFTFSAPVTGFTYRNNIVLRGQYGFKAGGTAEGSATLSAFTPNADFRANLLVGNTPLNGYPTSTWFVGSLSAVGFANLSTSNFQLTSASAYKGRATDGKDLGADIGLVSSLTSAVIVP